MTAGRYRIWCLVRYLFDHFILRRHEEFAGLHIAQSSGRNFSSSSSSHTAIKYQLFKVIVVLLYDRGPNSAYFGT